jgi:hypothetical protein
VLPLLSVQDWIAAKTTPGRRTCIRRTLKPPVPAWSYPCIAAQPQLSARTVARSILQAPASPAFVGATTEEAKV